MRLTALSSLIPIMICAQAQATPVVLATIKPIHSLVAAVMEGAGAPELLIQGAQSEHSYALKPSDADRIGRARVIFEVGPDLETYLVRPLATLASKAEIIALERAPGMRLLPARSGGLWEDGRDPEEGPTDPHIWLDPENAMAATDAIASTLSRIDPAHARLYAGNRDQELARLKMLEARIHTDLAAVRGGTYLVFHDGYRYFESRFGLSPLGAVTVAPDRPVGPRRIESLRRALLQDRVVCVFREPQFSPRLIDALVEGTDTRTGVLDPLGAELTPGPDLYPKLLQALASSLKACMSPLTKNR